MKAETLRRIRRRLGLSRERFGAAVGRTLGMIYRYESGQSPIPRVVELAAESLGHDDERPGEGGSAADEPDVRDIRADRIPDSEVRRAAPGRGDRHQNLRGRRRETDDREAHQHRRHAKVSRCDAGADHHEVRAPDQQDEPNQDGGRVQ